MGKLSPPVLDMSPMIPGKATMAAAVINTHERDPRVYVAGMKGAIRAVAGGVFPIQELLAHPYALQEPPLAMRDMEERPEGFLKGWIYYV